MPDPIPHEGPAQGSPLVVRGLIVLLGFLVPMGVFEACARVHEAARTPSYALDEWVYLDARPPPYEDADYFGPDFIDEAMHCLRGDRGPAQAGGWMGLGTFEGRYINVVDGLRATAYQPESSAHHVLVFGGSTVFSRRVPDSMTIPSHLQRMLNERPGASLEVRNLGSPGVTAPIQSRLLCRLPVKPGDRIIFYDGFNDVFNPIYRLTRSGPGAGVDVDVVNEVSPVRSRLLDLSLWLGRYSAAARLVSDVGFSLGAARGSDRGGPTLPKGISDISELEAIYDDVAEAYRGALVDAHRCVSESGGDFYHFLQPNLYIQQDRSDHEERVIRVETQRFPGLEHAVQLGYAKLREAIRSARVEGVVSVDLSGALAARDEGGEVYFDRAHVNHRANEIIARHMVASIIAERVEAESTR